MALSTLNDAVMCVGELLIPMVGVMKRDLLAGIIYRPTRRRSASRLTRKAGAIIKPTSGSMAHLAKAWCSTSAWAGIGMDQGSSWANSKACCRQTVTRHTPGRRSEDHPRLLSGPCATQVHRCRQGQYKRRRFGSCRDADRRTVRYRSRGQRERHQPGATSMRCGKHRAPCLLGQLRADLLEIQEESCYPKARPAKQPITRSRCGRS